MKKLQMVMLNIFGLMDLVLTRFILYYGGIELNPVMDHIIMEWYGVLIKLFFTLLVSIYLYYRNAKKSFYLVNFIMFLIVLNNTIALYIQYNYI